MPALGFICEDQADGWNRESKRKANQGRLQGLGLSSWKKEVLWGRAREAAAGRAGKGEAETRSNEGGAETRGVESDVGRTGGPEPTCPQPPSLGSRSSLI